MAWARLGRHPCGFHVTSRCGAAEVEISGEPVAQLYCFGGTDEVVDW